ncbi:MAG: protein kinase [candidate division KSB1 bacterium]|nr:protein kinase [candidate division KSB1 bacterium]MDZ7305040.1 protein kinase [candidate division KSB1 bacterium]MDZ7312896.1 protein kinase [candidate division KSB1 bacterium]
MPNVEPITQQNRLQQLLHTLGRAYLQKEQYAQAFEKFKQLLELDADNSEILLDTAIAGLGLNDVSEPTLALYEKAVAHNPDSSALKFGLASLFAHQNIFTPFAVELCRSVADLSPANERQIRLYLKKYYEAAGQLDKAMVEEQKAIFNSGDSQAIRAYLEKLWWDGKFAEAYAALKAAPRVNGVYGYLNKELALTHAYELLATGKSADNDAIKAILAVVPNLVLAESLVDLRDYLTLRLSLSNGSFKHRPPGPDREEHKPASRKAVPQGSNDEETFAVNPFNLREEILDPLAKPIGWQEDQEHLDGEWQGFMFAQISKYDGQAVPERLRNLLSSHLAQLPNTILRQSGNGFLSLAQDPTLLVRAMLDFMQNLEDYNVAMPESDRVMLIGALQVTRQLLKGDSRETLVALVETAHLLRYAEQVITTESGTGSLLLRSEDADLIEQKGAGFTLMPMEPMQLLPGTVTTCEEVVWRNPLAQLKPGQTYTFGRFEIRRRLLKHNNYTSYLAHDMQLDRPLIMKVMLPPDAAPYLQDEEQRQQLYARIRAIARLSHAHLAFLYDMGEHEGMLFFGREYIEGKNLGELNFRDEQRDGEILAMLQKIVRALLYANSKGVAHLNLKPGNIWWTEAQELKITDFRIPGFTEDGTNASVLYPAHWRYLAPEILFGETGDTRSDIYSLGIIAYELIAGRHPYTTFGAIQSPKDVFKARIAPLSEQEKPHHRVWDDFVMKALQRDADKRFGDLTEVDQELRAIQMEMLKKALNTGR